MSGSYGNRFTVLDWAVFALLLGNHLQHGVKFSEHLYAMDDNDVSNLTGFLLML